MPEHVHLLLRPKQEAYSVSKYMQLAKHPFARRVIGSLRKSESHLLLKLSVAGREGKAEFRFWLPGGGHDFNVISLEKASQKAEYCHNNPVKRGLVKSQELLRWSILRWLILCALEKDPMSLEVWT